MLIVDKITDICRQLTQQMYFNMYQTQELYKTLAVFCDGIQFTSLLVMLILYLIHKRVHIAYWRMYGAILVYIIMLSIVQNVLTFTSFGHGTTFYRAYILLSLMFVPLAEGLLYSLYRQGTPLAVVVKRVAIGEIFYVAMGILTYFEIYVTPFPNKYIIYLYTFIYGVWAFVVTQIRVMLFNRQLKYAYSSLEGRELGWVNKVLWGAVFLTVSLTLSTILIDLWLRFVYDFVSILVFCIIAYFVYIQQPINFSMVDNTRMFLSGDMIENVKIQFDPRNPDNDAAWLRNINTKTLNEIGAKLQKVMEIEKPYLSMDVTIADLAALVGTNTTYLSYYINNNLGTKFNAYINGFRLKAMRKALLDDQKSTIEYLAHSCGFKSIATMQRLFIEQHNCTASQYRQTGGKVAVLRPDDKYNGKKTNEEFELGSLLEEENGKAFMELCEKYYPSFEEKLRTFEPSLTFRDILLCMLIRLGYSPDQISKALSINKSSLNMTRFRLRIKLRMQRTDSLELHLARILNDD